MSEVTTDEQEIEEALKNGLKPVELVEWVFSADKHNPFPAQLLHLFYEITASNKLGIMQAKNTETGNIEAILVGVDKDEEGTLVTYPLARLLEEKELSGKYLPPRGDCTFVGEKDADAAKLTIVS